MKSLSAKYNLGPMDLTEVIDSDDSIHNCISYYFTYDGNKLFANERNLEQIF